MGKTLLKRASDKSYRRLIRRGAVVGAVIAAVGYSRYRQRTRPDRPARDGDPITERHATAFLIRRRVDGDRVEEIREYVSNELVGEEPGSLLGVEVASTATLFLADDRDEPALVWYVEVPRSEIADRDDPERWIDSAFPVAHEAIDAAEESIDRELIVHAAHPDRPRGTRAVNADASDERSPGIVDPRDDRTVDVDLVRIALKPGLPERLADWFAALSRRVAAGELGAGPVEEWSVEMVEREEMYTESTFIERGTDGYALVHYMEAEQMERVYDAYYDTWNPVARLSEVVLDRVLEEPDRILTYPLGSTVEPIAHAVAPNRPRLAAEH